MCVLAYHEKCVPTGAVPLDGHILACPTHAVRLSHLSSPLLPTPYSLIPLFYTSFSLPLLPCPSFAHDFNKNYSFD